MAIRFLHLRLRSITDEGIYGVDIPFSSGLVLLRAENSMGKSTCVQAILYALGLERMLSPSLDIPLPPAMLSRIERADGTEIDVLESWIELELANSDNRNITVFRRAKTIQNTKLITVYRPMREGFNLGFDLSASDGIRVIWGYLFSMLYLARTFQTNHPGILVFDEPKQQSANKVSFSSLLQHATEAADSNQQVFFATSEPVDDLRSALTDKAHTLIEISGKVLKRLP